MSFNQIPQNNSLPNLDQLMSSGTVSAFGRDDKPGKSVSGTITSIEPRQQTDFDTQAPKFFDDGRPMMQVVIHVQTDETEPSDPMDDGQRAIYVKGKNLAALRQASQEALGKNFPAVGDGLTATYAGDDEPRKRGFRGAKMYKYQITKSQGAMEAAMNAQPTGTEYAAQQLGAKTTVAKNAPAQQWTPAEIEQLHQHGKSVPQIVDLTGMRVDQVKAIIDNLSDTDPAETF